MLSTILLFVVLIVSFALMFALVNFSETLIAPSKSASGRDRGSAPQREVGTKS